MCESSGQSVGRSIGCFRPAKRGCDDGTATIRFFRDDGTEIKPDLIAKPSLCVSCRKDRDPNEEILCTLTRTDQQGEDPFECFAHEPRR